MTTATAFEQQTFTITEEILVHASLERTFESLIVQMGRQNQTPEGTLIKFVHTVVGPFPEDHRPGIATGWAAMHQRVRKAAESGGN